MKGFFSKRRNVVILSIILAVVIITAGIVFAIKSYQSKEAKVNENNQKAIIAQKSKTEILGEDKEETKKEYEEKYTEQYKKYLDLSDEEKEETEVVPKKYEVNYNIINNIIEDQKKDTDTETKKKEDNKADINYEFLTPKKFNLADKIKIKTENQGDYSLCWDFAATKSLETNLALTKKKNYDFSEMHVNYITSDVLLGNRELDDGGNFSIYEDYLVDSGVVLEKDIEYKDYNKDEYDKFLDFKPVVDVTKTVNFPTIYKYEGNEDLTLEQIETVRNAVKNHIMNYGSIYAEVSMFDYNYEKNNLYTKPNSESWIDHAVTIVGWDDDYSKNNFPEGNRPNNNGAYIALNSWGEDFGNKGYFYISYEDLYVESGMSGIVSTSYKDAYDINNIKNQEIKNVITQRLSNTIKEKDGKEYVTELALSKINYIDFSESDINSLKNIDIFNNLYSLNLSKTNIKDITVLKNCKELMQLDLSDTNVKDVSSLSKCESLFRLNLSNDEDVKGYNKIKSLGELYLSNCDIKDVSNIRDLKFLDTLDLSKNVNIKNIDKLNSTISCILLKECNLQNISDIKNIKDLNYIDLSYNNISDIDGIEELENLSYIDLSGNKVRDFSNIALIGTQSEEYNEDEFYPYVTLIVEDAKIADISLFNNLKNVSSLYLAKNNITDLSAFYNNSIYELDLSNNQKLYNLQYLKNLENLYALYLSNCNIQDLSEISKIKNNLEVLDLSKNNITNIEELNNLNLSALSLSEDNSIEGKLNIENLSTLNLENTEFDIQEFSFEECSNLCDLNISNCKDVNVINTILDNNKLNNIEYIALEKTEISRELLEKIISRGITLGGANVEINQSDYEDIVNDEETINIKDASVLNDILRKSIQYRDVYISGGKLNRNQYEIEKTSVNNTISIYIGWGLNIYEVTININYLNEDKEEIEDQNDDVTTKSKETKQEENIEHTDLDYEMVED